MTFFNPFKRGPDKFVLRLINQADACVEGLRCLLAFAKEPSSEGAEAVKAAEEHGDEERRILIDELNRTFVTPYDREDLFALSRAIDDVLDYANTSCDEMLIFKVKTNPYLVQMTTLLYDAGKEIQICMKRLQEHPTVANEHAVRAKSFENRMEKVYREAINDLFQHPVKTPEDVLELLKLREVYRHLSNAADRVDGTANIVTDIVMKSA